MLTDTDTRINELIEKFKIFLTSEEAKKWKKERSEKAKIVKEILDTDKVQSMTKKDFENIIVSTWASQVWYKKEILVKKILDANKGIDNIKDIFYDSLYSNKPLAERYDNLSKIKFMGSSMITEILTFFDSTNYCIWNKKPKAVLPYLNMSGNIPKKAFKQQISGEDYVKIIDTLSQFKDYLRNIYEEPNFLDVDMFFTYIFFKQMPRSKRGLKKQDTSSEKDVKKIKLQSTNVISLEKKEDKVQSEVLVTDINSHEKAEAALLQLGNLLNFDTYVATEDQNKTVNGIKLKKLVALHEIPNFTFEKILNTVKHIDVIWFKDGFPAYCFEVEDSTGVTNGLLRLYQIRMLNMVPIIAGPEEKRNKFFREIQKDPFKSMKDRFRFISYEELSELLNATAHFVNLKRKLLGC